MRGIATVWKDFVGKILSDTFSEFLTPDEIKERRDWILNNILTISPEKLYKNLIYMLSNNSISEIAVGYKLHFILDDWKELFKDPYTEEFDRNKNLSESDKKLTDRIIDQFGNVINHHVELLIHDSNYNKDTSITDLMNVMKDFSKFYELPDYDAMHEMHVESDGVVYKFDIGQILYFVAYNQNPKDGSPCSTKLSNSIKLSYPQRLLMMETLKEKWPNGIPLKYVRSTRIF